MRCLALWEGAYIIWLNPPCTGYDTNINTVNTSSSKNYPTEIIFCLKAGDTVKFVITNNDVNITNKWQSLYVGLATGNLEKVVSGEFQRKEELITEIYIEEDVNITALFVKISRFGTIAEFDLEVYVNGKSFFLTRRLTR